VTVTGAGLSASGVSNGMMLTPGQTATLTVTFAPTSAGAVTGANVKVSSNATSSPTTVTLSGTGQALSSHSVLLQWNASPTDGINGYNVFRGTSMGGESTTPVNPSPVSTLSYSDTAVASGQTYYYVVTAVNSGGNSTDTNEVSASIP
jgi:fibronectin type 3 domain-containing protein